MPQARGEAAHAAVLARRSPRFVARWRRRSARIPPSGTASRASGRRPVRRPRAARSRSPAPRSCSGVRAAPARRRARRRRAGPRRETRGGVRRLGGSWVADEAGRPVGGSSSGASPGRPTTSGLAFGRLTRPWIRSQETHLDALFTALVPGGFKRSLHPAALRVPAPHAARRDPGRPPRLDRRPRGRLRARAARLGLERVAQDAGPARAARRLAALRGRARPRGRVHGLSREDGRRSLLLARNFDFEGGDIFDRQKLVSVAAPDGKIPYLSVGFAGTLGVVSGFNREGIGVAIQAIAGGETAGLGRARHAPPRGRPAERVHVRRAPLTRLRSAQRLRLGPDPPRGREDAADRDRREESVRLRGARGGRRVARRDERGRGRRRARARARAPSGVHVAEEARAAGRPPRTRKAPRSTSPARSPSCGTAGARTERTSDTATATRSTRPSRRTRSSSTSRAGAPGSPRRRTRSGAYVPVDLEAVLAASGAPAGAGRRAVSRGPLARLRRLPPLRGRARGSLRRAAHRERGRCRLARGRGRGRLRAPTSGRRISPRRRRSSASSSSGAATARRRDASSTRPSRATRVPPPLRAAVLAWRDAAERGVPPPPRPDPDDPDARRAHRGEGREEMKRISLLGKEREGDGGARTVDVVRDVTVGSDFLRR